MRPTRFTTALRIALAAVLLGGATLHAQVGDTDPRDVEDPRDTGDPRSNSDPRDTVNGVPTPKQIEDLQGAELFEALWERGSTAQLGDAMQEDAWSVLGWIDSHCEKWLALVEGGGLESEDGRTRAAELVEKATQLASLADSALSDTRFSTYVHTFTNWDSEQQAAFRSRQGYYKEASRLIDSATSAQQALAALTPLERSLSAARPLGDTWGLSMTHAAIGRVHHANRQWQTARDAMRNALVAGRSIRDLDSVSEAFDIIVECSMALGEFRSARETLREQHELEVEVGDQQSAQRIVKRLVELEEIIRRVEQER